jgi:HlyD family secretion protein
MEDKKIQDKENKGEENSGATNTDVLEDVVFVLQQDGNIKKVAVKSGIQDLNYIQIISGLSAGDEVVTGPYSAISKTLKDGMKVKVVTKDKLFEK